MLKYSNYKNEGVHLSRDGGSPSCAPGPVFCFRTIWNTAASLYGPSDAKRAAPETRAGRCCP